MKNFNAEDEGNFDVIATLRAAGAFLNCCALPPSPAPPPPPLSLQHRPCAGAAHHVPVPGQAEPAAVRLLHLESQRLRLLPLSDTHSLHREIAVRVSLPQWLPFKTMESGYAK